MTQKIPIVGHHRGVGIHNHQSPARIELVKAAIDQVARLSDIRELVAFAEDAQNPPEARLFAASKVEIEYQLAAEERRNRPVVDLDRLRAVTTGLDGVKWRNPERYGTMFDHDAGVLREEPLPDNKE